MHVTRCRITLHENLFYATREIGRLYETGRYLHNYGLAYALGLVVTPYFSRTAVPHYQDDLSALNALGLYVTPARPVEVTFDLNTFKYADNRYRVKMEPSDRNTPTFGRVKELATGSTFEFVVICERMTRLPRWIRLGKWMSKASVDVIGAENVNERSADYMSSIPLNPLDIGPDTLVRAYDLISMPPVSLLDRVYLSGPHYRLIDGMCVPAGLAYRFPVSSATAGKT